MYILYILGIFIKKYFYKETMNFKIHCLPNNKFILDKIVCLLLNFGFNFIFYIENVLIQNNSTKKFFKWTSLIPFMKICLERNRWNYKLHIFFNYFVRKKIQWIILQVIQFWCWMIFEMWNDEINNCIVLTYK